MNAAATGSMLLYKLAALKQYKRPNPGRQKLLIEPGGRKQATLQASGR